MMIQQCLSQMNFGSIIIRKMEYLDPYPSSVPDITLIPADFDLDRTFFVCSLALESIFTLFALLFLLAYIYFSCGNHKLLLDHTGSDKGKKEAENIICQVLQKTDYLEKLQQSSSNSSSAETQKHTRHGSKTDLQAELRANQLRVYQRRVVYACVYTIPWVIAVNSLSASVILIILASVFVGLVVAFNILRMMPTWKITVLIYFVPALASLSAYLSGGIQLYPWEPVVDALQI